MSAWSSASWRSKAARCRRPATRHPGRRRAQPRGGHALRLRDCLPIIERLTARDVAGLASVVAGFDDVQLLVVDPLSTFVQPCRSLDDSLGFAARELKALALDANVALVATASLPNLSSRSDRRPTLEDLRRLEHPGRAGRRGTRAVPRRDVSTRPRHRRGDGAVGAEESERGQGVRRSLFLREVGEVRRSDRWGGKRLTARLPTGATAERRDSSTGAIPTGATPDRRDSRPARLPTCGATPDRRDSRPARLPDRRDSRPARLPTGATPDRRDSRPARLPTGATPDRRDSRPARLPTGATPDGATPDRRDSQPARLPPARLPTGATARRRKATALTAYEQLSRAKSNGDEEAALVVAASR